MCTRLPASFCGIVGLKPTVHSVSRAGVIPLSWTLDSIGPLTRTVKDAALVFDAISGSDSEDPITRNATIDPVAETIDLDISGMRLGLAGDPFTDGADQEVVDLVEEAAKTIQGLGARVEPFDFPEAREELDAEMDGQGSIALMCVEGYTCHRETLSGDGDFDPRIKERIEAGRNYTAVDYAEALRTQARLKRASVTRLDGIDALLAPTTLYPAPRIEDVAKAPARLTTALTWPGRFQTP